MAGSVSSALHKLIRVILTTACGVGTFFIPILQIKKLGTERLSHCPRSHNFYLSTYLEVYIRFLSSNSDSLIPLITEFVGSIS